MSAHVLIVDDNRELAENLAEILEDEGCRVTLAHSGEAALELFKSGHFDLVVTDVRMPGISGIELVRRLAARDPTAKFLLMTAHTSEALPARGVPLLIKPFAAESLLSAIQTAVQDE